MKILCAADIHIGRESSRTAGGRHTALEAWKRIVELALREQVDLVAVAGDVIDAAANYFQASGPLQEGLERIAGAGIHVVMIAGNHDHDSLRRFFTQFYKQYTGDKIHFLGSSSGWETKRLELAGGTQLDLVGRSFGAAQQSADPFSEPLPPLGQDGALVLGLLHADVDQGQSRYAPCSSQQLLQSTADIWLLGHVHGSRQFGENHAKLVFYPGSPQALDPGESGQHGVWIIEWQAGAPLKRVFHQISSLWYERLTVAAPNDEHQVGPAIEEAVRARLSQIALSNLPEQVGFRIQLTGTTAAHQKLVRNPRELLGDIEEFQPSRDSVTGFIDGSVAIETRPELDLALLAAGTSPAAILAGLILRWERGEEDPFCETVEKQLLEAYGRMEIAGSGGEGHEEQTPPDAKQLLIRQGYRLLAELEAGRNQ